MYEENSKHLNKNSQLEQKIAKIELNAIEQAKLIKQLNEDKVNLANQLETLTNNLETT